ncbi:MAG TPA: TonB-dependent receptor plug domain-containing protein, partial [Salinimicrobium sp.]|nr:TonB-dependent receptor plug domain-containing protein [Salinimicrobium sp.]
MKKILLPLLLFPFLCAAQQQIRGKVFDAATHFPLSAATVINSENTGTTTNADGEFSIACADKITISYIGYKTVKLKINNCEQFLEIPLIPLKNNLKDVEILTETFSDKVLLRQPVAKVRLDEGELSRGTGLFLDDAINANVPGVTMSRRAVSSGQQFNIRGYGNGVGFKGANNNFDTQGTKIYLNNIPITNAEGVTVLDDIDFASVGNVEIIKGPSGTLYGSAIAGVVKLYTVMPKPGQVSLGQKVLMGDYGLRRYTTSFQMGTEKAAVLVNYGKQESDGYMAHNKSREEFVNFIGEFHPNPKQHIFTYFGYSDSYDQRGGELTIEQYNNFDYSGNQRYIKNNAHSE